ncbi:hypothetical protein OAN96_00935 [Candidatus Gracilibacteria bacterium]|nr:hypothetical protein [Candidatus Gracilibacteria bacterium]
MDQIIFIHGGEAFDTLEQYHDFLRDKKYDPRKIKSERWKHRLPEFLGESFDYIIPTMPAKENADYEAWKIWFEKIFPYLQDGKIILVGGSLGGIFLPKYLSENDFPKNIDQLHLISGPFDESGMDGEGVGNFKLENFEGLRNIDKKVEKIFLYHSRDDFVVPYEHAEKYLKYLPSAQLMTFEDRGHFLQAEFPELIENIKNNI